MRAAAVPVPRHSAAVRPSVHSISRHPASGLSRSPAAPHALTPSFICITSHQPAPAILITSLLSIRIQQIFRSITTTSITSLLLSGLCGLLWILAQLLISSRLVPTVPQMASSGRYAPINAQDDDDHIQGPSINISPPVVPASPPPPFSSRPTSPTDNDASRRDLRNDDYAEDPDRTLEDAFGSEDSDDDGEDDSRRRLVQPSASSENLNHDNNNSSVASSSGPVETRVSHYPAFATTTNKTYGQGTDGVFANLAAKPSRGDDPEEKPPVSDNSP